MGWFDTFIYVSKYIIITVALADTSIMSHNYHFFVIVVLSCTLFYYIISTLHHGYTTIYHYLEVLLSS